MVYGSEVLVFVNENNEKVYTNTTFINKQMCCINKNNDLLVNIDNNLEIWRYISGSVELINTKSKV